MKSTIDSPAGYKFLLYISMVYMAIMIFTTLLAYRYVGTDIFFTSGGVLIISFIFILDDIIAEIYGYKITRSVILCGFVVLIVFTLICQLIVNAPYPSVFKEYATYHYILGPHLVRSNISTFAAYIIANLINSYVLTRWKVLIKGRYFWLRSIGSSVFAEGIFTFLSTLMGQFHVIPMNDILKLSAISFSIKIAYSIVLAFPASLLVDYVKRTTEIDVYDLPKEFTPFKYFRKPHLRIVE